MKIVKKLKLLIVLVYSPSEKDFKDLSLISDSVWQTIRKLLITLKKECKLTYTKSDLIRCWYRLKRFRGV